MLYSMNIFNTIEQKIKSIIEDFGQKTKNIAVQSPKDKSHGDMATNAAMVLAKPMRMKPRDIAEQLVPKISEIDGVKSVEIAGAGFINITFDNSFWQEQISNILEENLNYGYTDLGKGEKINVEYASPNPTGPMHIGHARGAVYGDILANLFSKMGYKVTREFYQNDAGSQIDTLTQSVYLRYKEALGEDIEIPDGLYPGEYLKPVGEELKKNYGNDLTSDDEKIKPFAISQMVELIKSDLASLGIYHDVFTSEQALRDAGAVEEALQTLEEKGLIYVGIPEKPQSEKAAENWQPLEQTLFKSSQFGDDKDRVVKKNDGGWTYFTPDIAYNYDKFKRGHNKMFLILGVDHSGYVKRLKAAVSAISDEQAKMDIILCQLVKFMDGGQPLKMSKRAGNFVGVKDVVERIGKDVIRFMMLTRKNDVPLDFDLQKAVEQSKDNPVFYVQYAHARCKSVIKKALDEKNNSKFKIQNSKLLNHPAEIGIIKKMCEFPRVMEGATLTYEPHRIAFYLEELAAQFHSLWNLGNDEPEMRFIIENNIELTQARLQLVNAVATVIACGLAVMGVKPVDEMR